MQLEGVSFRCRRWWSSEVGHRHQALAVRAINFNARELIVDLKQAVAEGAMELNGAHEKPVENAGDQQRFIVVGLVIYAKSPHGWPRRVACKRQTVNKFRSLLKQNTPVPLYRGVPIASQSWHVRL